MHWGYRLRDRSCGYHGFAQVLAVRVCWYGHGNRGTYALRGRGCEIIRAEGWCWGRCNHRNVVCRAGTLGNGRSFRAICPFRWVWDRPSFLCRTVVSFAPLSGKCSKQCPDSSAGNRVSRYRLHYFVVLCLSTFDMLAFPERHTRGSTDGSAAFGVGGKRLVYVARKLPDSFYVGSRGMQLR